jgi:hypothetical protein
MLNFPLPSISASLCLLTSLFFMPQIQNVAGQNTRMTSPLTLVGGSTSFLYEHGQVPPSVAHADFGVTNSSPKILTLKILKVGLATDKRTSVVEKFTASVCRELAKGRTGCVDAKSNGSVLIAPNSTSTLTIYFPSAHLHLSSREGPKKLRIECQVKGSRLSAETQMRVMRMEPWRRASQRQAPDRESASLSSKAWPCRSCIRVGSGRALGGFRV